MGLNCKECVVLFCAYKKFGCMSVGLSLKKWVWRTLFMMKFKRCLYTSIYVSIHFAHLRMI